MKRLHEHRRHQRDDQRSVSENVGGDDALHLKHSLFRSQPQRQNIPEPLPRKEQQQNAAQDPGPPGEHDRQHEKHKGPDHRKEPVQLQRPLPSEDRGQCLSARPEVLFNVAAVVAHHDEPDPNDQRQAVKKDLRMELPVRAGRCPERDQPSHDEPGDHLSQGKRRHRQRSSGVKKDGRSSDGADEKRDRSRAGARRKAGQQSGKKI